VEEEIKTIPSKIKICDYCGEKAITKCYFCGKDLCVGCLAWVEFVDKVVVRSKDILFCYSKPMCKDHLPPKRDCE